ncbi:ATP-dependent zinc metalloprotease FtsH, partial [Actinomadura kijaniata]
SMHVTDKQHVVTIPYTAFTEQVAAGNVKDVYTRGDRIEGELRQKRQVPGQQDAARTYTEFETQRPTFANDKIFEQMLARGVVVEARPVTEERGLLANLLLSLLPVLLFVGLWIA